MQLVVPARGLGAPHFAGTSAGSADPLANERIYVYSNEGLISLRYDGTDRRTHLRVTGPGRAGGRPSAAEQVLMRSDGKWALASVSKQLWLVAVPVTGGVPEVGVRDASVPVKRITDIGADYFAWADGGDTITWAIGSTFYRRSFDTVDFSPESSDDEDGEDGEDGDGDGDVESDADDAGSDDDADSEQESDDSEQDQDQDDADDDEQEHQARDMDDAVQAIEIVLELPRYKPQGTIALRGARIVTMGGARAEVGSAPGDGADVVAVIDSGDIVVTDNRIVAIGASGTIDIPGDARVVDVTGKMIVPGFVDTHAHWEFRTHDVLEPQNWSLLVNLVYGVTAGLDVQTSTNDYLAYQDLVETGQSIGQRAFMTGPGVFSNNDFQSYEATLDYLKRYQQHYRIPNIKSYMVGNRKQRQWVVKAAQELGLMPTTEGGANMRMDITHAIDGMHGNEHTLPDIPLFDDVVQLFARTKTAYTLTLLVQYGGPIADEYFFTRFEVHDDAKLGRFYPHNRIDEMSQRRGTWARDEEFTFDEAAAQVAKIQRAGGLIDVGGHGELQGLGYHWEMWGLGMGMEPYEVLQAATIDGVRIIGIDQDLGSLQVGKLADLVVLDANPLDDIHNTNTVSLVMKNGELFEGDTLTRIWPSRREIEPFWWWDAEPTVREYGEH